MDEQVSIVHPTTCGFGKVAACQLVSTNVPLDDHISKYEIAFEECMENFAVLPDTHHRNFPKIIEKIRAIGKRHKDTKNKVLDEFSMKTWKILSLEEISRHSLLNCKGWTIPPCKQCFPNHLCKMNGTSICNPTVAFLILSYTSAKIG